MEPLRLSRSLLSQVLEHLRSHTPLEACGLLGGQGNVAARMVPMRNTLASPTRFEMDPLEQLEAFKGLRSEGQSLVGIFHSHPATEAYPSSTDIQWSTWWEEVWFLIVSFREEPPTPRCFRIRGGQVREVGLVVDGDQ